MRENQQGRQVVNLGSYWVGVERQAMVKRKEVMPSGLGPEGSRLSSGQLQADTGRVKGVFRDREWIVSGQMYWEEGNF